MPRVAPAPASPPTEVVDASLRLLRIIQAVLLTSVVLYAVMGELAGPQEARDIKQARLILYALAGGLLVATGALRTRIISPAEQALRSQPDDALALARWRAGNIVSFALAEAVALYGLALRMMGATLLQALPFYAGAAALLLIFTPRRPE